MPKFSTKWNIEWNEPITLPALTQRMHEGGLGREDLVAVLTERDKELVDELCGPKYKPKKRSRYKRAGTKRRTLGTRLGLVEIRVHRVWDSKLKKTFYPIWRDIKIRSRKIYQDDVSALSEHSVVRMTYRNTREELSRVINGFPSHHTINRRVIEDGNELVKEIHERELTATTHQPDGTKLHSKRGGHHDVNIVLATSANRSPRLRSLTVGCKWKDHLPFFNNTKFQDEKGGLCPPTAVCDMEPGLAELMIQDGGYWQPCLVHVVRYTGFSLWRDDIDMDERKGIVQTVSRILSHLKNSLNCHLPKDEIDAVEHRIKQTVKEFKRLATRLNNDGMVKTAKFIRNISNSVTTFASLALQGISVPWHNNLLERLMGEVSKRCKHKWMTWTTHGGQALLALLVTRTIEPDTYYDFFNRKLFDHLKDLPNLGISITRLGTDF